MKKFEGHFDAEAVLFKQAQTLFAASSAKKAQFEFSYQIFKIC